MPLPAIPSSTMRRKLQMGVLVRRGEMPTAMEGEEGEGLMVE